MTSSWRRAPWPILVALGVLHACGTVQREGPSDGTAPFPLHVPDGWPPPPLRADNPLTRASVELGRALFFDPRLSRDGTLSCASCHRPGRAFSDTVALSAGVHGHRGMRNAPSLGNVAYRAPYNGDGGAPTLEQQLFIPVMDTSEMGMDAQQAVELLRSDLRLAELSRRAYGRPLDLYVLTRAIANYERTLLGGTSRYDRFLGGDSGALSSSEQRGLVLFNGKGGCNECHGGFDLSDHAFHNVGTRAGPATDPGRQRITLKPGDKGKFKTPGLRNVALTGPYMHNGGLATLEEVIGHFNAGGASDPNKDTLLRPLGLSAVEEQDLAAFLRSLTDVRSLDPLE